MDIATVIGVFLSLGLIVGGILVGGGSLLGFYDLPSVLIVFIGAMTTVLTAFPMKHVLKMGTISMKAFFNSEPDISIGIEQIVSLAETARREGLLALENRMDEINDNFLKLGIRMAIDGMGADIVESIMRTELDAVAERHDKGKALLDAYGKYAPAFGMIGTLVGLVIMLGDMSPDTIGAGMAVALLTTLYGAIASNAVFLPLADKLGYYNNSEQLQMEITVRGVIAIQAGENPRVIKQKLMTFVPPSDRPAEEEAAA